MGSIPSNLLMDLLRKFEQGKITEDMLKSFLENPNGFGNDDDWWYPLAIGYSRSVEQMIVAGRFDLANMEISSKNFKWQGKGFAHEKVLVIHVNHIASTSDIELYMKSSELKPARIEHLLALAEQVPNLLMRFPIVALGSVFRSPEGEFYPYICGKDSQRYLDLCQCGDSGMWVDLRHFLAIPLNDSSV